MRRGLRCFSGADGIPPESRKGVADDGRRVAGVFLVQVWRVPGTSSACPQRDVVRNGQTARGAMRCRRSPGGSLFPLRAQGALAVGRENGKKKAEETVPRKACTGKTRENPKRALSTNGCEAIP